MTCFQRSFNCTAAGFAGCFLPYIFAAQEKVKKQKYKKKIKKISKFSILKEEKKGAKKEPKRSQKGAEPRVKIGGLEIYDEKEKNEKWR